MSGLDQAISNESTAELSAAVAEVVGSNWTASSFVERLAYARDRLPYGNQMLKTGRLPGTLPALVCLPGSYDELAELLRLANARRFPIIPFGFGSGVLGGAMPRAQEVAVDLRRFDRVIDLDEESGLVTVQCGLNGGLFEEWLQARGFTAGHFPQSLYMSTVGGWLACRGAGQASSRYGKIEDMVVGLKAMLPDGGLVDIRPVPRRAVGPSLKDVFVGAEGTLGIILEATLRVWRRPAHEQRHAMWFPSLAAAFAATREIMQSEIRPSVVRLYDRSESRARGQGETLAGRLPFMCIMTFSGLERLVEVESELARAICAQHGAEEGGPAPIDHWLAHRYHSYSPEHMAADRLMDTIEVAAPWKGLEALYDACDEAARGVAEGTHFSAHWSHVYPEGACMYMTVRFPEMAPDAALDCHAEAWDRIMRVCLDSGATVSHHHGVGWFRARWMMEEWNRGHAVLRGLKQAVDPNNILNPGKLGLPEWRS